MTQAMPRHKFWGAGEPDCPADIKAPNGPKLYHFGAKINSEGQVSALCFASPRPIGAPNPQEQPHG